MVMVNGVAEMKDVVSASEIDYYRILQARTEAQKDIGYTSKVIQAIDSLAAARMQNTALDTILLNGQTNGGWTNKSLALIVDDFISQGTSLISTSNWNNTVTLFNGLTSQKDAYTAAQSALATAQLGGNAADIAQKEQLLLVATEGLRQNIDGFITALRMEKKIGTEALDYLLDTQSTLGGQTAVLNATALQKEVGDAVTRTNSQYDKLNEAAVNYLANLVNSVISGGQQAATTSATMIKAVDDQIAQLMGGTNRATAGGAWNGSSYDFGLFEGRTNQHSILIWKNSGLCALIWRISTSKPASTTCHPSRPPVERQ